MTITLNRPATCRECGAHLEPGTRASWYRNGAVYGLNCHAKPARTGRRYESLGARLSRLDPRGLYTSDGRCIARRACGHEDYPCCGC